MPFTSSVFLRKKEKAKKIRKSFPRRSNLSELLPGEIAYVSELQTEGAIRRRLSDLGLIPGTRVECVGESPAGDPVAYLIRGAVIALRRKDSSSVLLQ